VTSIGASQIRPKALEILGRDANRTGLRLTQLYRAVNSELPAANYNTIRSAIWNLDEIDPDEVYKPARGLYRHTRFRTLPQSLPVLPSSPGPSSTASIAKPSIDEEAFYQPFADFLIDDLEECTRAIPLGGHAFGDKWATPDVIGVLESRRSDVIKSEPVVVSAEVKYDTSQVALTEGFGQACAYQLYSNLVYLVLPADSDEDTLLRLESLCQISGLGLVLFDRSNPIEPDFTIRVRPIKHEPDLFYVNQYLARIETQLFRSGKP
jgi:hypothetical protein